MLGRFAEQYGAPLSLRQAMLAVEALITPLPSLFVFAYFIYCCGEDRWKSAAVRIFIYDNLFVEFDTPNTFFRIPPLTLQPIVENAMKHGLDPDLEPLYVSISTQDTEQGVLITVEDTGPGYALSDEDEPNHALNNIRERLKAMCGGTLEIEVWEAGNTVNFEHRINRRRWTCQL